MSIVYVHDRVAWKRLSNKSLITCWWCWCLNNTLFCRTKQNTLFFSPPSSYTMLNQGVSLRPFHLRILFPHLLTLPKTDPRRTKAPKPITQSTAIDLELYTYFALLLRDFIHPWYKLLTTDEDLSAEIIDLLILIVQKLEKRLCEEVRTLNKTKAGL